MTSNLQKPDLSKDTTGPFVTRDGRKAVYVPLPKPIADGYPHLFDIEGDEELTRVTDDGTFAVTFTAPRDIFLAPKEPRTVFVNWYRDGTHVQKRSVEQANKDVDVGRLALLQLEVDDQGVPVDGGKVRRVEL